MTNKELSAVQFLGGTAAGKYASQLLKASYAAQPKGYFACFVPLWKNYWRLRYNQQQPVGEESPLGELPAADLSCSCRKSYTPAAVMMFIDI